MQNVAWFSKCLYAISMYLGRVTKIHPSVLKRQHGHFQYVTSPKSTKQANGHSESSDLEMRFFETQHAVAWILSARSSRTRTAPEISWGASWSHRYPRRRSNTSGGWYTPEASIALLRFSPVESKINSAVTTQRRGPWQGNGNYYRTHPHTMGFWPWTN